MIQPKSNRVYKAFGLHLSSEIHLPELTELTGQEIPIDVTVKIADLSKELAQLGSERKQLTVLNGKVMLCVQQAALFRIEAGNSITVSPMPDYDEDKIRLFLLGSCMGAILMQRKILPLHGSAVEIDGRAVAFVGKSGVGKSTLATAFTRKGFRLISDDVIPVIQQNGAPYVIPAYPQQRLWLESINSFGMNAADYHPLFNRFTKYAIPVPHLFAAEKLPLAAIFEMGVSDEEAAGLSRIDDIHRLQSLYTHTFRNKLIEWLDLTEWHFHQSIQLAGRVDMFRIVRNTSGFTVEDMVSLIISTLQKEPVR